MTDDTVENGPNTILRVAVCLLVGILILSGLDGVLGSQFVQADGVSLNFNDQPNDGDTVTISGHVFEFDTGNGVTAGNVAVLIGQTVADTVRNFADTVRGV